MRKKFILASIVILISIWLMSLFVPHAVWLLIAVIPVILLGLCDMLQTRHTIRRNFPVIGRMRWLMESVRPMIQQYFIESDISGAPVSRVFRSVVYQRAKQEMDTIPFGTKFNVYRIGYEWIGHSLASHEPSEIDPEPRILIGGEDCSQPYNASVLNISAMSFGALSSRAISALNGGAKKGGFAHNTGEGGISQYHLEQGGDLIWQIGTGYFGCRTPDGHFDEEQYQIKAAIEQVKMIEIKLSQGAKPGHGGLLPASKNSPEIAEIRGIKAHMQVNSPGRHSAFGTPIELMLFIKKIRQLANGKPVGIKLCIGHRSDFIALCKAMKETNITPDFITVDGGEGGTGAAPLEYSNSIGMPLTDAIVFVSNCLNGFSLKSEIKIIASAKIFSGFHIIKRISLGADLCNSARGMMLAMGCIQSLQCNANTCPTGITTQDPALVNGLVVNDKINRVANYHTETVRAAAEIMAAAGLANTKELDRSHIFRRVSHTSILQFDEIYPPVASGSLLGDDIPQIYKEDFQMANPDFFNATTCKTC
jgi:glutamate synthase domain-containing protein 2